MMISGTGRSSASRLIRLHTENPFKRGSSTLTKIRSGRLATAAMIPVLPSLKTCTLQPNCESFVRSSTAKLWSDSKIRTLGIANGAHLVRAFAGSQEAV